jgi:glycerophosphoryl diester phosphodiesterase
MRATTFPDPIAHRGLHDRAGGIIENSASAFASAIAHGFAIECDVQLTADGHAVIFHDDNLERLLGRPGAVADCTAEEITALPLLGSAAADRPQRLTEFLQQIDGQALLQIELKHQRDTARTKSLARAVAAALRSYAGAVTVESFDPDLLMAMRQCGFGGSLGIITYDYRDRSEDTHLSWAQRFALRHLLHWPRTRFDFISCAETSLDLPAVRFWRARGMQVTAWTVRSPAEVHTVSNHADQIVFEGFHPKR